MHWAHIVIDLILAIAIMFLTVAQLDQRNVIDHLTTEVQRLLQRKWKA